MATDDDCARTHLLPLGMLTMCWNDTLILSLYIWYICIALSLYHSIALVVGMFNGYFPAMILLFFYFSTYIVYT